MSPSMRWLTRTLALRCLSSSWLISTANAQSQSVHFDIDGTQGNHTEFAISSFIENNVNRADDSGLYAELIQNRAFQETNSYLTLTGWAQVGNIAIQQDPLTPLAALPQSLQIFVPKNKTAITGQVAGVFNRGWFGMSITPQNYSFSFFAKNDPSNPLKGSIHLSLNSLTVNKTFSTFTIPASAIPANGSWIQLHATLPVVDTAIDGNNILNIMLDVLPNHDNNLWINLVSLFPETFMNRKNGARKDLAEALKGLQAKFVRIPGGSDLQGSTIANRYNWSDTIGPLQNRKGRVGYWTGYQTEGLGLMELLQLIEDMGSKPIVGLYDAYSASDESIPNNAQLEPFIQDAVNEVQFLLGDPKKNKFAKMRSELGHPEPFDVPFFELGNEDFTSKTYDYRWERYTAALKKEFPNIQIIATSTIEGIPLDIVDTHDYSGPEFFYNKFSKYDNWPRNNTKIIELEGAVISTDSVNPFGNPAARLNWTTLQASVAEAVVAMGLQRNGDLVIGSSYAPNLANVAVTQWTPNLITFNATNSVLSTSYYVQQMVSLARSDTTHPVSTTTNIRPLYWVASSSSSKTFFLQIANIDQPSFDMTGSIILPSSSTKMTLKNATMTVLTNENQTVVNTLDEPFNCVPQVMSLSASLAGGSGGRGGGNVSFEGTIPGFSFSVLKFELA